MEENNTFGIYDNGNNNKASYMRNRVKLCCAFPAGKAPGSWLLPTTTYILTVTAANYATFICACACSVCS